MDPSIVILMVTVGVSIWAFNDYGVREKLIFSPYAVMHRKQWYRILTHAFIHADWMHLLFNMIALWSFGAVVLRRFSEITSMPDMHFYIMYVLAIIFSSLYELVKHRNDPYYSSLGASGAVSAVVFASILFDPWSMILVFVIPCPGILFAAIYLWYSSYMSKHGNDNIGHNAHFYGAVFGVIYPILVNPSVVSNFIYQLVHPAFNF